MCFMLIFGSNPWILIMCPFSVQSVINSTIIVDLKYDIDQKYVIRWDQNT